MSDKIPIFGRPDKSGWVLTLYPQWQSVTILSPYLFVRLAARDRQQVFQAGTVMEYLRQNGDFIKLAEEEVERIRKICKYGQEAVWSGRPVQVGDMVELIGGALKGLRGIAVEEHGRWQIRHIKTFLMLFYYNNKIGC